MSVTQNEKIRQVTETTMVIGVDIARDTHWARAFDWRGLELSKAVKFENSAEGFHYFLCWASELAAEQICTPFTGHPVEGVLLCGTHMSTKGNV